MPGEDIHLKFFKGDRMGSIIRCYVEQKDGYI